MIKYFALVYIVGLVTGMFFIALVAAVDDNLSSKEKEDETD